MSFTSTKSWCLSYIFFFSIALSVMAQPVQLARYEVLLSHFDDGFEIIPADKYGVFLRRGFSGTKADQIELTYLDTTLTVKWQGFVTVEKNYSVFGQQFFEGNLYLLLRYRDYSRNDLRLIVISTDSGEYVEHKIKGYIPFAPVEFQVMPRGVVIGGYFNKTPLALFYSLVNFKSRILPGLMNEPGELNQIRTNHDETFDVVLSATNFQKQKTIWIKHYDYEGGLLSNMSLDSEDNKHLIFGRLLTTPDGMQIVAGVYGNRFSDYSRGVFICSIDPAGNQQIRFYSFGDLENFFKYMKAKREQRVKQRIERRKVKGKKVRFNYRFLVHQLIPYNNQFLLMGEAFYPQYTYADRSNSFFTQPGFYGPMYNGRIFDGYYYTHAVVIAFNNKGELLWDNSFEINDIKTYKLEQFVQARLFDDKIALFYFYENKVRSKIIHNNEVLEANTEDLQHAAPAEVAKGDKLSTPQLDYWYKDIFVANGVQNIETPGGKHKRRVYFVDKIAYRRK